MARSPLFARLLRSLRLASWVDARRVSTAEGFERRDEFRARRRALLVGSVGALGCAASTALPIARPGNAPARSGVVIVGAGLAGLTAAARLTQAGIHARVFDAQRRVGGRAFTLRGHFAANAELGGELIDTRHTAIRGLVRELGLTLVDRDEGLTPGIERERYVMLGQSWSERQVVEMFRPVAGLVRRDRALLGGREVTHAHHTPAAESLDALSSTGAWLDRNGVRGPLRALLDAAFTSELGRDLDGQSALSFLATIGDDPGRFSLFGESDERYVVAEGSDAIARTLAARLGDALVPGHALVALRPRADGGVRCVFEREGGTAEVDADRVILALPFNQLRRCELAIELPPARRRAITELPYGTNTKVFIATNGRPWRAARSSGTTFSDGGVYHESWESIRTAATDVALLTAFSGGRLGVSLGESNPEAQGRRFAEALDVVFPGSAEAFTGRAARMHWPAAPFQEGSYACYGPGDWCRLGGEEAGAVGAVHFAGEHTSRRAPGYMEGAVESGERAAREVVAAARAG